MLFFLFTQYLLREYNPLQHSLCTCNRGKEPGEMFFCRDTLQIKYDGDDDDDDDDDNDDDDGDED